MALVGEIITMNLTVVPSINEIGGSVLCYSPRLHVIHKAVINNTQTETSTFFLHNVQTAMSGEYYCEIRNVRVYWSLMVKGELWCLCTSIAIHIWLLFLLCNIELLVLNYILKQIECFVSPVHQIVDMHVMRISFVEVAFNSSNGCQ